MVLDHCEGGNRKIGVLFYSNFLVLTIHPEHVECFLFALYYYRPRT